MAIMKCKMCGGDLELTSGSAIATCEYCGTTQTVPSADNEKKLTLFTRANKLRFGCEFDKAAGVYEAIVADFPEEAEAYWGLVLCKYGIEYVDDPVTGQKIPTCHRSSFDSVMEDNNFDLTLENADVLSRKLYREEAKQIEEIRKGIIEVSSKEDPYDIFICYKETTENGERTLDSVLAQDIYSALTEKGYRVFFSRITLEDKLGQKYEPYIFAALNSAKVMLALGTDYEYFNAVWVKNEWSRYLKLIEAGQKKTLIPCYKGIDAYDMPKEFAKLQAQDLGKVGAMQDLLRGIDKLIAVQKAAPVAPTVDTAEVERAVIYRNALETGKRNKVKSLKGAIKQLESISGWQDADEQCALLKKKLKRKKRAVRIRRFIILLIIAGIAAAIYWQYRQQELEKQRKIYEKKVAAYELADEAMDFYLYERAQELYVEAGDYSDAAQKADSINAILEEEAAIMEMRLQNYMNWDSNAIYMPAEYYGKVLVSEDGSNMRWSGESSHYFIALTWSSDNERDYGFWSYNSDDFSESWKGTMFDVVNGNKTFQDYPCGSFRYDTESDELVFITTNTFYDSWYPDSLFLYGDSGYDSDEFGEPVIAFRGKFQDDGSLLIYNEQTSVVLLLANGTLTN